MKRTLIFAASMLAVVAVAAPAQAQTRDEIMEKVVQRCFDEVVDYLKIDEHDEKPFATIVVTLDRKYHKELIAAVDKAVQPHTKHALQTHYELDQAVCIRSNAAAITCRAGEETYSVGAELNGEVCFCSNIGCYWKKPK